MVSFLRALLLSECDVKNHEHAFYFQSTPRVHKCLYTVHDEHKTPTAWKTNVGSTGRRRWRRWWNGSLWLQQATFCPFYPIKSFWLAHRCIADHACRSSDADRAGLFSLRLWWLHCSCSRWALQPLSLSLSFMWVLTRRKLVQYTKTAA